MIKLVRFNSNLINLPYRGVPDKEKPDPEKDVGNDNEEGGEEEDMTEDAGFAL